MPCPTSPARRALLLGLAAVAACRPDFPLPSGAQVTCGSDADCPGGTVCRTTLGRCVQAGGDVTAPQLVASSLVVTPARVGAGTTTVVVELQVSEALATDPEASLRLSGAGAPARSLTVVSRDETAHRYVLSYHPVPGTDTEGDVSFVARFLDAAGNEGRVELPRVAVFDFTPPALAVGTGGAPVSAVTLTPPATSPLRTVTAATAGTRLRVDFAAAEPLAGGAASPAVSLAAGGAPLTFAQVSGNGLSFVYEAELPPGFPEGPAPLSARLVDLAANAAVVPLGTVTVKTQRPASPAVDVADAVLFHRIPWGSDATGAAEAYFLRGAPGAVDPGAVVIAYSDPTVITSAGQLVGRELGRVPANADGGFGGDVGAGAPFQLFMGDAPDLYVAAVDAAGNVSDADGASADGAQAALVRDVAWTATMIGKIPGRVFPNPHAFEGRQVWTSTLAQVGSKPIASPAEVGRRSDGAQASTRGAPWWQPARRYGPLGARGGAGIVHDPVRGCRVAYGGEGWDGCDSGYYCSQWESCRGAAWTVPTAQDPEGDGNPALGPSLPLVFAGGRGTSVLSDGSDLWEWDGTSWRKLVMSDPEGDGNPPPRRDHAIAYDEARQRLVLFGGLSVGGPSPGAALGDTWETDFRSWRRRCTAAPCNASTPEARSRHAMVYDPARKVTLLVAGALPGGGFDPATWLWTGTAWTPTCTTAPCAASSPAQRADAAIAFDPDPARSVVVLFGGSTAGGRDGGTYEWNGATWSVKCTGAPCSTSRPTARWSASLFHDPERGRTVLFGGASGGFGDPECPGPYCGTEWEWDGSTWTPVQPAAAAPPNLSDVWPIYDPVRDRVVLFGGRTASSAYSSATSLWDGTGWAAATPTRVPPGRAQYGAAWVTTGLAAGSATSGYVAIADGSDGGAIASTAIWDGVNWTTLAGGPSARTQTALAQSPRTSLPTGALLFGGQDGSLTLSCDTWELRAGTWTRLLNPGCSPTPVCSGATPPERFGHAMVRATDFVNGPVLLFGGRSTTDLNDVWMYSGGAWSCLSAGGAGSATQPPPRIGHGLLFDPGRRRVLLSGGRVGAALANVNCVDDYGGMSCHDFWEWSEAGAWTRVYPVDVYGDGVPTPSRFGGLAFDTRRGLGVGIEQGTASTLDTWWWHGGAGDRPAQVMTAVFDAAEVRRPFDVLDLEVTWVGGASGSPGGAVTPGASLRLWDNRAWIALTGASSATASPSAPEVLHWSLANDAALGPPPVAERQRFMVGDPRSLSFALVPASASGSADGFGQVGTDYVEVTVRYRVAAP